MSDSVTSGHRNMNNTTGNKFFSFIYKFSSWKLQLEKYSSSLKYRTNNPQKLTQWWQSFMHLRRKRKWKIFILKKVSWLHSCFTDRIKWYKFIKFICCQISITNHSCLIVFDLHKCSQIFLNPLLIEFVLYLTGELHHALIYNCFSIS